MTVLEHKKKLLSQTGNTEDDSDQDGSLEIRSLTAFILIFRRWTSKDEETKLDIAYKV